MPTRAIFLLRSSSASANDVKKLSQVTTCPWSPSVICSTTLIPWFTSARSPAAFPVQTCSRQAYDVLASKAAQIFMPYLAGFFGMYCPKLHLPLNRTSCSSTVRPRSGLNNIIRQCPHVPYLAKGSQFVGMAAGSGELVVKPEGPGDVRKSFVGHRGSENAPSRFLALEAGGSFVF